MKFSSILNEPKTSYIENLNLDIGVIGIEVIPTISEPPYDEFECTCLSQNHDNNDLLI